DIQVYPIQGSEGPDRICAVREHTRRPDGRWRLEELGQRATGDEVVELLVLQASATQNLLAPALRLFQSRDKTIDRVHGAWVVDVVGGHERGIHGTRPRGVEHLIDEAAWIGLPREDPVDPKILG